MDSVNVRNLDQIQEDDPRGRSTRLGTLVLASVAGTAIVTALVLHFKPSRALKAPEADPLAALVAQARAEEERSPEEVGGKNATFTRMLSDDAKPTTALAAVTDEKGRLLDGPVEPAEPASAPPATDKLPLVPLSAGTLLQATPVTKDPKDDLTAMAVSRSSLDESAGVAPPGAEGGYQIQVASFQKQDEADAFVEVLRKKGHRAYRQAAHVPARGLWHRVRIGPFKSRYQAQEYKKEFEKTERVSPFLVDPHKVQQQKDIYEAKREARRRRLGE